MFALRGLAVSLALFGVCYCTLSLLVAAGWRMLLKLQDHTPRFIASALIAVRLLPLISSLLLTTIVIVPSFLLLEPRAVEEDLGIAPLLLGVLCIALLLGNVLRAAYAQARTSRLVKEWLRSAQPLDVAFAGRVFQARETIPALTVAGVCRPRLLLSASAVAVLSPAELRAAVRHEVAHVRFHDNFKKLALRLAWFPFMSSLEKAWQASAELAADDAAVNNADEALDLATAIVKVLRHCKPQPIPAIGMAFVQDASVRIRIDRLLHWEENRSHRAIPPSRLIALVPLVAMMVTVVYYGPLLNVMHAVTEWLMR